MRASIIAAGWSALVLAVAWDRRPAPSRVRALLGASKGHEAPGHVHPIRPTAVEAGIGVLIERVGRAALRVVRMSEGPGRARNAGLLSVAIFVTLPFFPPLGLALAFAGVALPTLVERSRARRRAAIILRHLPETVDLLLLAAGSGLNVSLAVAAVARRAPSPFAEELTRVSEEAALGRRLADALEDVVARTDEVVRPLIAALVAGERYGAPLGEALDRLAHEVRAQRRRRAEEAARRVPVKLLFPLVMCILPAFGLLTLAPVLAGAFRALRL